MTKHTPTPWEIRHYDGPLIQGNVLSAGEKDLAILNCGKEDAAFIVEAVNNYDRLRAQNEELLGLLKEARNRMIGSSPSIVSLAKRTDEAIAKAEGREL